MLPLAEFCHDAIASTRSLKSLKSALKAFVFSYDYLCHIVFSPPDVVCISLLFRSGLILLLCSACVNNYSSAEGMRYSRLINLDAKRVPVDYIFIKYRAVIAAVLAALLCLEEAVIVICRVHKYGAAETELP